MISKFPGTDLAAKAAQIFGKFLLSCAIFCLLLAGCSRAKEESRPSETGIAATPEQEIRIAHDLKGKVTITLSSQMLDQLELGMVHPEPAELKSEISGFGQVIDPAPLISLVNEIATARAGLNVTSNEVARLQSLAPGGNASARAVQAAQAAAERDRLAVSVAADRLALGWGMEIAANTRSPGFVEDLASRKVTIVRVDVAPTEKIQSKPTGASVVTLSGETFALEFLGVAPSTAPETQAQGFWFLLRTNVAALTIGQSLTARVRVPGEPRPGCIVPRDAIVRQAGAGWVYVREGTNAFSRVEIPLDHPGDRGFFVSGAVMPKDELVIAGAQQLLSAEMKGRGSE